MYKNKTKCWKNLQIERSHVKLSGSIVRFKVLPKYFSEHRHHLCAKENFVYSVELSEF